MSQTGTGGRWALLAVAAWLGLAGAGAAYEDLPPCAEVPGGQDCQVVLDDGALVFGYGAGEPSMLMVSQADPRGAWIAKIPPFEVYAGPMGPEAMDVLGDETAEVLVPIGFGTANVAYMVLGRGEFGRFEAWGEVLGGAPGGFDRRGGLLIGYARNGAASYVESAWTLSEGALVPVYDLVTDLSAEEPAAYCALYPGPGWSASGLAEGPLIAACQAEAEAAMQG